MDPIVDDLALTLTRRHFLGRAAGLGSAALASLLDDELLAASRPRRRACRASRTSPAEAKRVIYLFQSGAPSQLDLFDYKPQLQRPARRRTCPTRSARASGSPA